MDRKLSGWMWMHVDLDDQMKGQRRMNRCLVLFTAIQSCPRLHVFPSLYFPLRLLGNSYHDIQPSSDWLICTPGMLPGSDSRASGAARLTNSVSVCPCVTQHGVCACLYRLTTCSDPFTKIAPMNGEQFKWADGVQPCGGAQEPNMRRIIHGEWSLVNASAFVNRCRVD